MFLETNKGEGAGDIRRRRRPFGKEWIHRLFWGQTREYDVYFGVSIEVHLIAASRRVVSRQSAVMMSGRVIKGNVEDAAFPMHNRYQGGSLERNHLYQKQNLLW